MQIDLEKLNKLIAFFKKSFVEHWDDQKYNKWQSVKHFQDNWNIEAEDFAAMFEKATKKTANLLTSQNFYPVAMITTFAKREPSAVRKMFEVLYDESIGLSKRIEFFKNESERLRIECDAELKAQDSNSKGIGMHYQNDNAISTYLWLRYPQKYYIYKYSEYRNVARELDYPVKFTKGARQNIENGFAMYDAICNELQKDEELKSLLQNKLTEDCFHDDSLKTLTIDFGYQVSNYYGDEEWLPKGYNPGITKEQWGELIKDKNIFDENSLIAFACLQNASNPTCNDMAKEFGRTWQFYNNNGWRTGQRVFAKTDKQPPKDENNDIWLWSACCSFRKNKNKLWEFKIHPELQEAFEETGVLDNIELNEKGESGISDKIGLYKKLLLSSHNLILHGAPGTGKTHLAKDIARAMGAECEMVQFHPSYDYTDFVEGLRPVNGDDGQIGFERKDGVFKKFCRRALKSSIDNSSDNFDEVWNVLIEQLNENDYIEVPLLAGKSTMRIELNEYGDGLTNRTYEGGEYQEGKWIRGQSKFFTKEQCYNIYKGLNGIPSGGHDNYRKAIVRYMKDKMGLKDYNAGTLLSSNKQPFVFIIDEINRGELSKIFGELFFSIDPGYRGIDEDGKPKGLIHTQYQNLIEEGDVFYDGFYIPENVYIIGTMNDIDRSVESMDFAFRRRFTFKEVKATDTQDEILNSTTLSHEDKEEAKTRMNALNEAIVTIGGFSPAYHIGAAYFKKLECFDDGEDKFESLWDYHLEGLLREYLRGMEDAEGLLAKLKTAYDGTAQSADSVSERQ